MDISKLRAYWLMKQIHRGISKSDVLLEIWCGYVTSGVKNKLCDKLSAILSICDKALWEY